VLMLSFTLGDEHYALPCEQIEVVLPYVHCRHLPLAPTWLTGVMVYQGHIVPVIDLCQIAEGRQAHRQFGTRILLMHLIWRDNEKKVGFLVENMTQTCQISDLHVEKNELHIKESPWLGDMGYNNGTLVQLLKPEAFLSDEVCAVLFEDDVESGAELGDESNTKSETLELIQ